MYEFKKALTWEYVSCHFKRWQDITVTPLHYPVTSFSAELASPGVILCQWQWWVLWQDLFTGRNTDSACVICSEQSWNEILWAFFIIAWHFPFWLFCRKGKEMRNWATLLPLFPDFSNLLLNLIYSTVSSWWFSAQSHVSYWHNTFKELKNLFLYFKNNDIPSSLPQMCWRQLNLFPDKIYRKSEHALTSKFNHIKQKSICFQTVNKIPDWRFSSASSTYQSQLKNQTF